MTKEIKHPYMPAMTRRESLKWLGALAASSALPVLGGCDNTTMQQEQLSAAGHWPELKLEPISVTGYGKDPNLIVPPESPWPLTLTPAQLTLVAVVADILVPKEGSAPSASEVKVPEVVNEWVSAPYERQQQDRVEILSTLAWLDDESQLREKRSFVELNPGQQLAIIDDIAYDTEQTAKQFKRIVKAFSRFRGLVLAAFFSSPEGTKDIGYMGNVPISGDYPGPTDEAMKHLAIELNKLGLTL